MVRLTSEGEVLLSYARQILRTNDEAVSRLREPELEGLVRLGTPEDFATTHLPDVLAAFAQSHPRVALEVTCDLTLNLLTRFHAGEFHIVLVKREPQGSAGGVRVWREPLVWVGNDRTAPASDEPLSLVVSPQPCVYRKRAIMALDAAHRPWRVAYTSTSLAGTQAAVKAKLGLTVLPKNMVASGLQVFAGSEGLPELKDTEIALHCGQRPAARHVERLAEHIVVSLEVARTRGV